MRRRYSLSEPEFEEERVVAPITMEGAMRLAKEILLDAYHSYMDSLKTIMKLRKYIKKVEPIIQAWDKYQSLKTEVSLIKNSSKNRNGHWLYPHEQEKIYALKKIVKPKQPSSYQIKKLYDYYEAESEKINCEVFYKSKKFHNLSLGKIPGEEVIQKARTEVGWFE